MMLLNRSFYFGGVIGIASLVMCSEIAVAQEPAAPAATTEAAPATETPDATPATPPAAAPGTPAPAATPEKPAPASNPTPTDAAPPSTADEPKTPPKAPPKRDEYTKRPGAARKPLENYRSTKQMAAQPPQGVRLDDLLKGNNPKDQNVDLIAKANAFGITKPGNEADRTIINELNRLADGRGNANAEVVKAYKSALVKYLGQVLDNSVLVQLNALNIASEIQNGSNDVSDAVALFLKVLDDDKRQDPVLFMALKGLVKAKDRGLIRANEEQQAVGIILKQLEKPDVQSLLKAKLIETLGVLERPYLDRPRDARVASVIGGAAIDPNNDIEVREAAGKALARMRLSEISGWNSALQAQLIARALRDSLTEEPPPEANPTKASEAARIKAYHWAKAINKGSAETPNQGNEEFKTFAQTTALDQILVPILKKETPNLEALSEWIEKHPITDKKLAPNATEIATEPAKSAEVEKADAGPNS